MFYSAGNTATTNTKAAAPMATAILIKILFMLGVEVDMTLYLLFIISPV
jgi:hypothetical protein